MSFTKLYTELIHLDLFGKVTAMIMQNNGSGLHSSNSSYFDTLNDNVAQVHWPTEKRADKNNCRMICILTVCGMSL